MGMADQQAEIAVQDIPASCGVLWQVSRANNFRHGSDLALAACLKGSQAELPQITSVSPAYQSSQSGARANPIRLVQYTLITI